MLPRFVIVGTMKGGTSALIRGVKSHPHVFSPPGKEVHFFDRYFTKGIGWYEEQFAAAEPGVTVGEATPDYMYGEDVVGRMTETLPTARFIAILRNPADRTYSHYWHNVRRGRESLTLEEALAVEHEALSGSGDRPASHFAYVDKSRYIVQLRQIESRVGRDRMLVLHNDDLRNDRAGTLRRTWEFIGVDPGLGNVGPRQEKLLWKFKSRMSPRKRALHESYPPIDPEFRTELLKRSIDDVAALEEWWDRDLSSWKPGGRA